MKIETKERTELFRCKCSSCEHLVIVNYWLDDKDIEVYMSIHLAKERFFQRLLHAIRYIFGYRSKYGDFDEIILRPEDWKKMQDIAEHLKKGCEK